MWRCKYKYTRPLSIIQWPTPTPKNDIARCSFRLTKEERERKKENEKKKTLNHECFSKLCRFTNSAYLPFFFISSACVPCSTTRPWSNT